MGRGHVGWELVAGGACAFALLGVASCAEDASPFGGSPTGSAGTGPTTTSTGGATTTTSSVGGATTTSSNGGATTTSSNGGATTTTSVGGQGGDGGAGGAGTCPAPMAECDGLPSTVCETNTDLAADHCGGCNQPCTGECEFGVCREPCDTNLAIDVSQPTVALRAIGLCDGVVDAAWVQADGTAAPASSNYHRGHGVLPDFGPNVAPQEGSRLLALSSGTARRPGDAGYAAPDGFDKATQCAQPAGFPVASPSCPNVLPGEPHDSAAIRFTLTAPARATGFSFKSKFYTFEWPEYVCSEFADVFLALTAPPPPNAPNGNTIFDGLGNTMGAHNAFVDVCGCADGPPCAAGGLSYDCPLGSADLVATGFEGHAATGWTETRVPIGAGTTFTIRFAVYDSADGILDSTTLIDDWHWIESPGNAPVTLAVPNP